MELWGGPSIEAARYNGTLFAYGQTSAGKTFTLLGTEEQPGVTVAALANASKHAVADAPWIEEEVWVQCYQR